MLSPIHWDEFYFLSRIYEAQRGELREFFLTFHVHLFAWLTSVGGTEVDQILVARRVVLVLASVALSLLYLIARRNFKVFPSVCVVLGYLSFSEISSHLISFRSDTILLPCLLAAVLLLVTESQSWWKREALVGLLMGFSLMISLKAVLFFPMFVALLALRGEAGGGDLLRRGPVLVLSLLLCVFVLGLYHSSAIAQRAVVPYPEFKNNYGDFLSKANLARNFSYLISSMQSAVAAWVLLLSGVILGVRGYYRRGAGAGGEGVRQVIILSSSLLLPLFYRNAFPYFYVLILATAAYGIGYFLNELQVSYGGKGGFVGFCAFGILLWSVFVVWSGNSRGEKLQLENQRRLLEEIHLRFPQPVPYLDRCSAVGSFPKVGFFMSTYWLEQYEKSGRPLIKEMVLREKPQFIIANIECLDLSLPYKDAVTPSGHRLHPEDWAFLKSSFRPLAPHLFALPDVPGSIK